MKLKKASQLNINYMSNFSGSHSAMFVMQMTPKSGIQLNLLLMVLDVGGRVLLWLMVLNMKESILPLTFDKYMLISLLVLFF